MRIAPLSDHHCPWYLKPFFWNQKRKYSKTLDAALLWARSPRLFLGVTALYGQIDRRSSPIDPAFTLPDHGAGLPAQWMCLLRRPQLGNPAQARRFRGKALALRNWRNSDLFTPRERVVLDYAEAMTLSGTGVMELHFEALRREFSDDSIIELTGLVASRAAGGLGHSG